MKIELKYYVNGAEFVDTIERDCETKDQAGQAAIDYAKSKGSRHFPFFKVVS